MNQTPITRNMSLSHWSRVITWPGYWPLIGPEWSHDLGPHMSLSQHNLICITNSEYLCPPNFLWRLDVKLQINRLSQWPPCWGYPCSVAIPHHTHSTSVSATYFFILHVHSSSILMPQMTRLWVKLHKGRLINSYITKDDKYIFISHCYLFSNHKMSFWKRCSK